MRRDEKTRRRCDKRRGNNQPARLDDERMIVQHDERTRQRRNERRRNNQPARLDGERMAQ